MIDPVTEESSRAGGLGGSNGLHLAPDGHVFLCEHGNRRVARLEADGTRTTVIDRFEGKRLNSPNDMVFQSSTTAYFTDPSYGLPPNGRGKELDWNGVYRLDFRSLNETKISLVLREMSNPNGIGLSPDGKTLYVAASRRTARSALAKCISTEAGSSHLASRMDSLSMNGAICGRAGRGEF